MSRKKTRTRRNTQRQKSMQDHQAALTASVEMKFDVGRSGWHVIQQTHNTCCHDGM
jgi:hypothetical protein